MLERRRRAEIVPARRGLFPVANKFHAEALHARDLPHVQFACRQYCHNRPSLRRLRHVANLAGLGCVEAEIDRSARAALAFDPATVVQQFPHHPLGEIRWTAQVPALRLISEAMAQHAVDEINYLRATNLA